MRVLFICSGNNKFGVAPFIASQAQGLIEAGISVDFFTINGRGLFSYIKAAFKLRSYLRKNSFDILHAHFGYSGWTAVLSFSKIPLVVSLMGSDVYGTFQEASVQNINKKSLQDLISIYSTRILLHFTNYIIVKSQNLYEYIPEKFRPITEILPNGVDFSRFEPMPMDKARIKLNLDLDKKYILFLGDPKITRKNFKLAKEALDILNNNEETITLLAPYPIDHIKIPLYMNAANVLLLSSFEEGSPNVVKEALICNKPVVCTNVGDVKEHLSLMNNSFLTSFEPMDVAKNLKKVFISNVIEDSRTKLAHLNSTVVSQRIIRIYKQISQTNE